MVDFYAAEVKREMLLPDGSRIVLNKHSKVSYASDFNKNERVVYLSGEAFFDVKKTAGKTFTVYSGNTITQVLGTSFTVRSYEEEGTTEVQVLTGKVAFSTREDAESKKVLLTPGYKGVLSSNESISKTAINDPNFLAWKDNKLAFSNTRMDKVIATLEKYFDVPIEVSNPKMLECRFTGTFESPELQEIIDVLVISVDLIYTREDDKYILSGQGCNK
jgi:ferric-dicitrate binding protein FerR (iron transport regulator)